VGSLEISILRDHTVEQGAQLPLGTVRLMTTLDLPGVIRPAEAEQVRRYVRALLESKLAPRPNLGESIAVALGGKRGNAGERRARPAAARLADHGVVAFARTPAGHSQARRARAHEGLRGAARPRRRDGRRGHHVSHAGALPEPAYLCPPRRGRARRAAAEIAREAFSRKEPHRVQTPRRASCSWARAVCAADWI